MLKEEKIHPSLAFIHCGMFSDADGAFEMSKSYYEELLEKMQNENPKISEAREEINANENIRVEKENA
jgi:hypothetical protein